MTDRELMQQALDALEGSTEKTLSIRAMKALRNRLAHCDRCGKKLGGEGDIHTCTPDPIGDAQDRLIAELAAQPEQEPYGWVQPNPSFNSGIFNQGAECPSGWVGSAIAVHTAPPAAQRKPLTPEAIRAAGGIVHKDGNLFFTNLEQLNQAIATPPAAAPMTEFEEAVAAVDNTLHHAIDHWQDRASEQAVLLRECRFAIDTLIEKKPALAMLLCGSTTLGNLKASLHDYRVKGIFDDTPPAAQRTWVGLTDERVKEIWLKGKDHGDDWLDVLALARSFEAELKELNT